MNRSVPAGDVCPGQAITNDREQTGGYPHPPVCMRSRGKAVCARRASGVCSVPVRAYSPGRRAPARADAATAWWRGKFAWEYKRKGKYRDLADAYRQLCLSGPQGR